MYKKSNTVAIAQPMLQYEANLWVGRVFRGETLVTGKKIEKKQPALSFEKTTDV
jgi:hypothetical protein